MKNLHKLKEEVASYFQAFQTTAVCVHVDSRV